MSSVQIGAYIMRWAVLYGHDLQDQDGHATPVYGQDPTIGDVQAAAERAAVDVAWIAPADYERLGIEHRRPAQPGPGWRVQARGWITREDHQAHAVGLAGHLLGARQALTGRDLWQALRIWDRHVRVPVRKNASVTCWEGIWTAARQDGHWWHRPGTTSEVPLPERVVGQGVVWAPDRDVTVPVRVWDKNGQHLGIMLSQDYGVGQAQRIVRPRPGTVDPRVPGYALIRVPDSPDPWRAQMIRAAVSGTDPGEFVWVAQPTLKFLHDQLVLVHVEEWIRWEHRARVLAPLAARLRDLRDSVTGYDDRPHLAFLGEFIKLVYTRGLGLAASRKTPAGDRQYRPDLRQLTTSAASVSMLRVLDRARRAGQDPHALMMDALYLPQAAGAPAGSAPGQKIGQFKIEQDYPAGGTLRDMVRGHRRT